MWLICVIRLHVYYSAYEKGVRHKRSYSALGPIHITFYKRADDASMINISRYL